MYQINLTRMRLILCALDLYRLDYNPALIQTTGAAAASA